MKFVADENIPLSLVKYIRNKGFSIKVLKEENLTGITDQNLVNIAKKEKMILITFDNDFINLLQFPIHKHNGIIVLRYRSKLPKDVIEKFSKILKSEIIHKFENTLTEIFDDYIKIYK